jgi:hypothetical protein
LTKKGGKMMRKVLFVTMLLAFVALCSSAAADIWQPKYSVDGDMDGLPYRERGIAVFGENDVAAVYGRDGYTTYCLFVYTNAQNSNSDGKYSLSGAASMWTNPDCATDTNTANYGWGCVINPKDNGIYATFGGDQCPILSWDTSGNSLNKAAQTRMPDVSIQYTAAMDVDTSGVFYISAYGMSFDGWTSPTVATGADLIVLPATTDPAWTGTNIQDAAHASGHNPTPIGSIDCDGDWDINEGCCVKPDGTVVWITNRAGPTEYAYRYVKDGGNPFGWTKDAGFSFEQGAGTNGSIRGIDCTSDGLEIFTCWDDGTVPSGGYVSINNGTTGAFIRTIDVKTPAAGLSGTIEAHDSPYDIEITSNPFGSPTVAGNDNPENAKNMWIAHYFGWFLDKWQMTPGPTSVADWALY